MNHRSESQAWEPYFRNEPDLIEVNNRLLLLRAYRARDIKVRALTQALRRMIRLSRGLRAELSRCSHEAMLLEPHVPYEELHDLIEPSKIGRDLVKPDLTRAVAPLRTLEGQVEEWLEDCPSALEDGMDEWMDDCPLMVRDQIEEQWDKRSVTAKMRTMVAMVRTVLIPILILMEMRPKKIIWRMMTRLGILILMRPPRTMKTGRAMMMMKTRRIGRKRARNRRIMVRVRRMRART